MEKPKKRCRNSKQETNKKAKIETGEDAFNELDEIIEKGKINLSLQPFPEPVITDFQSDFFDKHAVMKFTQIGKVFGNRSTFSDNKTELGDDVKSLILSNQRWEYIAKMLKEKCVELNEEKEELRKCIPLIDFPPS